MEPEIVILIHSGKGGSGKTTIAAQLARKISEKTGVAVIDADIRAPNLLQELGADGNQEMKQISMLYEPIIVDGIQVMSPSSLFKDSIGIEWDDEDMIQFIDMLYSNILWNDARVLIIDTEPSDVAATEWAKKKFGNRVYSLIVTTTDEKSISNCKRIIDTNIRKGVRLMGIVGNMVGDVCPSCGANLVCASCGEHVGTTVEDASKTIYEFAQDEAMRVVAIIPRSIGSVNIDNSFDELINSIMYKIDNWYKTEIGKKINGVAKWIVNTLAINSEL
jgi:Mrp family chromosome partitioning ATPase